MEHIERIIHLLQQSELTQEEYNQIIQPTINYLVGRIKEELEQAYAVNNYKKVAQLAMILLKISQEESKTEKIALFELKQQIQLLNKTAQPRNSKNDNRFINAISTAKI